MAPKKKSFLAPRNAKNAQIPKSNEKRNIESSIETNKIADINNSVDSISENDDKKKYSKRSVESNWDKYEEPQVDPHADSMRGRDFNVLLSYSGGSGSQLKLQDEKEWEDDALNAKEISLNLQELISCMKCIPFHERFGLKNIFDEKQISNFILSSEKWKMSYKSQPVLTATEPKDIKNTVDSDLNIIEEPDSYESEEYNPAKIVVQEKTETIIEALASNLSFEKFTAKEEKKVEQNAEVKNSETASSDLDFLLSLNISSKLSTAEESSTSKNTNVDDWLSSILDD